MPDNVPPLMPGPVPPQLSDTQARTWNMWCHLSALSGFVVPFGFVLGPLLVWQLKKNEFPSVEAHGKAALNFQLTVLIALVAMGIGGFILTFIFVGIIVLLLLPAVGLCGTIFAIIAGVKANEGKEYRYPYSFNLVT